MELKMKTMKVAFSAFFEYSSGLPVSTVFSFLVVSSSLRKFPKCQPSVNSVDKNFQDLPQHPPRKMNKHLTIAIFLHSLALWSLKCVKCESQLAFKQDITDFNNSIAIDATSFVDLVNKSKVFVDTTLLITEVLQPGSTDLHPNLHTWLWLGPDKIGKSINLDMIKTFFEIQVDEKGNETSPKQSTTNYKLFTAGELHLPNSPAQKLKSPLAISKNKTLVDQYLGQHPVIHVQFKDTDVPDLAMINKTMKTVISRAYKQHDYMIHVLQEKCKNDNASCDDLKKFQNYLHAKEEEAQCGVSFLTKILHNHFKRKVIVLLDDYDSPLLPTLRDKELEMEDVYPFMELLVFKIFDSSERLLLVIITAKYKVEAQYFNTEKQLVRKDDPISLYFGFDQKIVNTLFEKHNINDKLAQTAHQWYDGYQSTTTNQHFYNPDSIAKFLQKKEIVVYSKPNPWYTDFIQLVVNHYPSIRNIILSLLSKQTTDIDEEQSGRLKPKFDHLLILLEDIWRNQWYEHEMVIYKKFFWYLAKEGYLAILPNSNKAKLLNGEMAFLLSDRMIHFYKTHYDVRDVIRTKAAKVLRDFLANEKADTASVQESLGHIYDGISLSSNKTDESTVRSIFYSVALQLQSDSRFEIDVFFNQTRKADVVVVDKQIRYAAIVEISFNETSAEPALQLAEKHDGIFAASDNLQKIKLLGINIRPDKSVQVLGKLKN